MKTVNDLPAWFLKQNRNRQWMIGGIGLFFLVGLCGLLSLVVSRFAGQSAPMNATVGASNLAFITWTPAVTNTSTPTSTATVPAATRTPLPTGLPTQSFETATVVILPTSFVIGASSAGLVAITAVDKKLEYADIQNVGSTPVSLSGWKLVSEVGNQSCVLRGILQAKEVLRIWAGIGPVGSAGINCEFKNNIWLDEESDPAVLYNAKGQEVSRFPRP
jgi:Lamin Tail Domain